MEQARGTHTPTHAWSQPYQVGNRSHGQLFGPYWGSSTWHSRRVYEREKSVSQRPSTAAASAKHSFKRHLHTKHGVGELLAGNSTAILPRHARGRRIMGWCMCAPCFKFVFWKQWAKLFYCIKNLKSLLYIANFSTLNFMFLSEAASHVILRKIYWSYKPV